MTIQLLAKHFRGAYFGTCDGCSLAKALKERFKTEYIVVDYAFAIVDNRKFNFDPYYPETFATDATVAQRAGHGNAIIREINLIEDHEY